MLWLIPMTGDCPFYDAYIVGDISMCPVCDCSAAATTATTTDNYAGFRIYMNEHSSYSYSLSDGFDYDYIDDNIGFGTTVGNNLTDYLRVEYETLYIGAQYTAADKDFEYDIWANMLNAYLMWDIDCAFAPYLGAGLGLTGIWGEIDGHLDNAFGLSYQVMVGVLFHLNRRIDIDVGFKYINFGRVEHSPGVTRVDATQIYFGGTYKFGI